MKSNCAGAGAIMRIAVLSSVSSLLVQDPAMLRGKDISMFGASMDVRRASAGEDAPHECFALVGAPGASGDEGMAVLLDLHTRAAKLLWKGAREGDSFGTALVHLPHHDKVAITALGKGEGDGYVAICNSITGEVDAVLRGGLGTREFGREIAFVPAADRHPELLLISMIDMSDENDRWCVRAYDVEDLSLRFSFYGRDVEADWGGSIAVVGDIDDDGALDVAISGGSEKSGAYVSIVSAASGEESKSILLGRCRNISPVTAALGDLDGDQIPDLAVGYCVSGSAGAVSVLSSADAGVRWRTRVEETWFGGAMAFVGSTPGGSARLYVTASRAGSVNRGAIFLLDAADGRVQSAFHAPDGLRNFGHRLSVACDVDKDGFADLLVSEVSWRAPGPGRVHLVSGSDLSILHSITLPALMSAQVASIRVDPERVVLSDDE